MPATSASGKLGDADGDGDIGILDATCIQRKLASLPVTSYDEKAAEVDGDSRPIREDCTTQAIPSSSQIFVP